MKVLVTGFEPFGKHKYDAAMNAVVELPRKMGDHEIATAILPASYTRSGRVLIDTIRRVKPDAVICVGQNEECSKIRIETTAENKAHSEQEDADHNVWMYRAIDMAGRSSYRVTIPVSAIQRNLRTAGIDSEVSDSAGTFVGNCLLYQVLQAREKDFPKVQCGLIHVPLLPEQRQEPDKEPCIPRETIVKALEIAVGTVIDPMGDGTVSATAPVAEEKEPEEPKKLSRKAKKAAAKARAREEAAAERAAEAEREAIKRKEREEEEARKAAEAEEARKAEEEAEMLRAAEEAKKAAEEEEARKAAEAEEARKAAEEAEALRAAEEARKAAEEAEALKASEEAEATDDAEEDEMELPMTEISEEEETDETDGWDDDEDDDDLDMELLRRARSKTARAWDDDDDEFGDAGALSANTPDESEESEIETDGEDEEPQNAEPELPAEETFETVEEEPQETEQPGVEFRPKSAAEAAAAYFAKTSKGRKLGKKNEAEDNEIYYGSTKKNSTDAGKNSEVLRRISASVPEKIEYLSTPQRETLFEPAHERMQIDTSEYRVYAVDDKFKGSGAETSDQMTLTEFMEEFMPERKLTEWEKREEAARMLIKPDEYRRDKRSYEERRALRKKAREAEEAKEHEYYGDLFIMNDMMRAMGKTLNKNVLVDGEIYRLLYTSIEESGDIIAYKISVMEPQSQKVVRVLGALPVYAMNYEKYYLFMALGENKRIVCDPETYEVHLEDER